MSPPATPLETAVAIGRRLVDEAIWDGARCGWVGPLTAGEDELPTYGGLGPDVYGGTAGVGLVLGELAAVTGDEGVRRTALGAVRHALGAAGRLHPELARGLYSGRLGIALAAARVGTVLRDDEALERAADLTARVRAERTRAGHFDLVAGRAGAVIALLALARLLEDPRLVDWASRIGSELSATAERNRGACSWRVPWDEGAPGLTGLSHGAAGVGYALLELHRVTRSEPFRATALAAFEYERGLFDPEAGNWLDLSGGSDPDERRFLVAWCHGAPGIALTRLRALDLLDDAGCRADAVAGTRTTREEVRAGLATGSGNYSLCHGLAGNAEILLHARDVLGGAWEAERTLALEVAEAGIERHGATGRWPGGLRGEAPGLMLGLAGTALFYLRLHDPSVPSVLLPGSLAGG